MSTDKILDISMLKKSTCQNTNAKPVNQSVTPSVTVEKVPTKKAPAKKETPRTDNTQPVTESVTQPVTESVTQPVTETTIADYPALIGTLVLMSMEAEKLAKELDRDKVLALENALKTMSKTVKDIPTVKAPVNIPGVGIISALLERTYDLRALTANELMLLMHYGLLKIQIGKARELAKTNKDLARIVKALDDFAFYTNKGNTLETPHQIASTAIAKAVAYDKAGRELEDMTDDVDKLILAIGAEAVAKFGEFITNRANTFDRKQGRA